MKNTHVHIAVGMLACMAFGGAAKASEITGETIFDKKNPRVAKVEQSLEESQTVDAAEFKQAKIKFLRAQLRAHQRAVDLLTAEGAAAEREGDKAGAVAVADKKKALQTKVESIKTQLADETGVAEDVKSETLRSRVVRVSAPGSGEPARPAPPVADPLTPPSAVAPASQPAAVSAPADPVLAAPAILADEVPSLMLGKWKRVENGRVCGYYLLESSGQIRTYKAFKASGAPDIAGGTWRVSNTGEVTLIGDMDDGRDTLRVTMATATKAAGAHWVRKTDGVPYREGDKAELVREAK